MRRQIVSGKGNCNSTSAVAPEPTQEDLIRWMRRNQDRNMQRIADEEGFVPIALSADRRDAIDQERLRDRERQIRALRFMRSPSRF